VIVDSFIFEVKLAIKVNIKICHRLDDGVEVGEGNVDHVNKDKAIFKHKHVPDELRRHSYGAYGEEKTRQKVSGEYRKLYPERCFLFLCRRREGKSSSASNE
jgi:hypothetical protein